VRWSVVLLMLSLAGVVGGALLVGRWCVGVAVIFDSLAVGGWALLRDDGHEAPVPQVHGIPTLEQVLDRARGAG
jgi:hypothetical protein